MFILNPGPDSKSHCSLENTTGERSEGPQTVPKATPTRGQAKQGWQVLVRPSLPVKFTPDVAFSRRCQTVLWKSNKTQRKPANEAQVEYWLVEAEVLTALTPVPPHEQSTKEPGRIASREAGDSNNLPSEA